MKKKLLFIVSLCSLLTSCASRDADGLDNAKTAKRHFGRGIRALCGSPTDSRQVAYRDQFWTHNGYGYEDEFIALRDDDGRDMVQMENIPQSSRLPGDPGSGIPGIESFKDPARDPKLANVYRNIHFPYNSSLIKGNDNLKVVEGVAANMKKNPNTHLFIEGHCDERGSEAYNLALGTRRANAVRNLLIKEGISPDRLYTISYGKERPLVVGHDEETWGINRRAQFRVYHQ